VKKPVFVGGLETEDYNDDNSEEKCANHNSSEESISVIPIAMVHFLFPKFVHLYIHKSVKTEQPFLYEGRSSFGLLGLPLNTLCFKKETKQLQLIFSTDLSWTVWFSC